MPADGPSAYPVELTGVRRAGGKVEDGLADWRMLALPP